eukprot:624541-Hanusia_phi.AAC.1
MKAHATRYEGRGDPAPFAVNDAVTRKMPVNVEFNLRKKAIPATPATQLVEVLVKACEEFKQDPARHCLRHKKKCGHIVQQALSLS